MKSTYRGISYEPNQQVIKVEEGEIGGHYRGANWHHQYPRHIPAHQSVAQLKYRGVEYCIGDPIDVGAMLLRKRYESTATSKATANNKLEVRADSRKEGAEQLSSTHLANLRQNLERRLEVAREKGDETLIRLLEAEAKQLAAHS